MDRPGLPLDSHGVHGAAVHQHLLDGVAAIRIIAAGTFLAVRSRMGQLRRSIQGGEHASPARVELHDRDHGGPGRSADRHDGPGSASASSRYPALGGCCCCSCSGSPCRSKASSFRSTTLMRDYGLQNTRLAIALPLIGIFMPFSVFWMNAHFSNMPEGADRERTRRRRRRLGAVPPDPRPVGSRADRVAGDLAVVVDVEPVPPGARARRGPDETDDGGSARGVPGSVRDRHPPPVRGGPW